MRLKPRAFARGFCFAGGGIAGRALAPRNGEDSTHSLIRVRGGPSPRFAGQREQTEPRSCANTKQRHRTLPSA